MKEIKKSGDRSRPDSATFNKDSTLLTANFPNDLVDEITTLIEAVKLKTGYKVSRTKMFQAFSRMVLQVQDDIDYSEVHDEATLIREMAKAIMKNSKVFSKIPDPYTFDR